MSAAGPGRLSRSASKIVVKPAKGYHLMRIDGYSQTKALLPGQKISSQPFDVGGHSWRIDYYPNGRDASANSDSAAVSVYLELADSGRQRAQYKFSLLDKDGIAAYELPAQTGSFFGLRNVVNAAAQTGLAGAAGEEKETEPAEGYEEFIGKEELEKRRGDLIGDDSIMIRCDVGVTQVETTFLAQDDIHDQHHHYFASRYGGGGGGYGHGHGRHGRRQHRTDDKNYVQWCLNQGAAGLPDDERDDDY